jgi:hypothetical protein
MHGPLNVKYRKHIHYHSDILGSEDFDSVKRPSSYYQINISNANFRDRLTMTHQLLPSQQKSSELPSCYFTFPNTNIRTLTYICHFSNICHSTKPQTLHPMVFILPNNTMSSMAMLVTTER